MGLIGWIAGRVPLPVLLVLATLVLAGLDVLGAIAAKEWADRRSWLWFSGGLAMFALLFWTYGATLRYASLGVVTIAWVSLLQVALLLIDRFRYSAHVTSTQWAVAGVCVLAQGYLLLTPSGTTGA